MKQINILKKAAGAISILLLLLSLAACGNMLEERKGNTVVEPVENTGAGILVRGEIKVQGAVPSRAATSCFDGAFSWRITAQNLDIPDMHSLYTFLCTVFEKRLQHRHQDTALLQLDLPVMILVRQPLCYLRKKYYLKKRGRICPAS